MRIEKGGWEKEGVEIKPLSKGLIIDSSRFVDTSTPREPTALLRFFILKRLCFFLFGFFII